MEQRTRVLVVDDEVRGLELAQRILRRVADVTLAESGEAALEILDDHEFDVVVSDQRMPGMSGVDLLTRVAQSCWGTGRILLTGYADMEATLAAINQAGVHAYLNKPCPPEHFRLTVDAVLSRMATVRENARLAERHRELRALRPAMGEVVESLKGIVSIVDPTDNETHARMKRASEAGEQLEQLLNQLEPGTSKA